ncbi:galactose mutarotase-like [Oppia nitens]|uniref:galactose mutarotase-like n=1 Tax=Oppia nitens TaxID=1686743 RepID=UPI0023D99EEA|nr:galactose mutarotase-like [Oppia nitens]
MPVKTQVYNKQNNINQYTLSNKSGNLVVKIIDYGATITHILTPDKTGQTRDVVLGWDDLDGYFGERGRNPFFGAAIGRCGNRIIDGNFQLNGQTYLLALNNGPNALHGGIEGFDKKKWNLLKETDQSITLGLVSKDEEEGYPGQLAVEITYSVTEDNELRLEYLAKLSDNQLIDTIVNLTNHSYFNLNGCTNDNELDVLNHKVLMKAQNYLEINDSFQPTGRILSTKTDTQVMDFATKDGEELHTIGERINQVMPNGYDHCYVIETNEQNYNIKGNPLIQESVVVVNSPLTGITLTFSTTEPGFQFYTGNNVSSAQVTKTSQSLTPTTLKKNSGFCLEAQRFPNAINENNWRKQVVLSPKQTYNQTTVYKFGLK